MFELLVFVMIACWVSAWAFEDMVLYSKRYWLLVPVTAVLYFAFGSPRAQMDHLMLSKHVQTLAKSIKTPKGQIELLHRLDALVLEHPQDAQAWYWLGRVYFSTNQYALAEKAFGRAHALAPELPLVSYELAQASYFASGQLLNKEARDLLQSLLAQDPYNKHVLNLLAVSAYHQKDYHRAYRVWSLLANNTNSDLTEQEQTMLQSRLNNLSQVPGIRKSAYTLSIAKPKCLPHRGLGFLVVESRQPGLPPLAVKKVDFSSINHLITIEDKDEMMPILDYKPYQSLRIGFLLSQAGRVPTGKRHWLAVGFHKLGNAKQSIQLECK